MSGREWRLSFISGACGCVAPCQQPPRPGQMTCVKGGPRGGVRRSHVRGRRSLTLPTWRVLGSRPVTPRNTKTSRPAVQVFP